MYLDLLGEDVLAVKFLPSMIKEKQGVPLHKLGAGFLTFAGSFPREREARAIEFSDMFSRSFIVDQDQSLYGLSSKITTYTISDCVCAIADGLGAVSYTHLDVYKRQGQLHHRGSFCTDHCPGPDAF